MEALTLQHVLQANNKIVEEKWKQILMLIKLFQCQKLWKITFNLHLHHHPQV
jgi:hypothetical protein